MLHSLVSKKLGSKTSTNIMKNSAPITPFQPGMLYRMPILAALPLVFPAHPQPIPLVAVVAALATPAAVVSPVAVAAVAAVAAGKNLKLQNFK